MLDLLRENQAAPQEVRGVVRQVASDALQYLKILDPKSGDKELIKAFAVGLAELRG